VSRDLRAEDGCGLLWFHAFLVWVLLMLTIVLIDVGGYLVAAARAQNAADAAALAAVSTDVTLRPGNEPPREAARRVADAAGAALERCDCRSGAQRASVAVSVPVSGLVIPRIGMQRVTAVAQAHLVP
jgi:secretion/DNA translocation related TadE-like protein